MNLIVIGTTLIVKLVYLDSNVTVDGLMMCKIYHVICIYNNQTPYFVIGGPTVYMQLI